MLKNKILGRKAISGFQEIKHSCTVRFLDDTEPITISFQVRSNGGVHHTTSGTWPHYALINNYCIIHRGFVSLLIIVYKSLF